MEFIKQSKAWENVAKEAYKAHKKRKEYEELEKKLLAELKEVSSNESSEYGKYRFQKIERKGSVDYMSIPEIQSIDLDSYRKKSSFCWKLFIY